MELFYNPERMTEREIKETFVAHQWLVDEIISILKRQPDGPGVQHVVIVAPRGMGKTTMLLMLRFTVMADEISKQWQPVLFPEESYDVYELADLWLAVLNHIAAETKDSELQDEISKIATDASDLEEHALARVKNWRTQNDKRLMLLIDNFDMILDQIGDERDNARLRDVLMNDGTLMLVGGGTTFFKEARAYEQPLYNLFKIYNLNNLDSNQIRDLLRRRAQLDELKDFDETLRANESRIRVLEYFTGGNPRLVLMLYRIITHSDISEVRRGLEKLLDEVTPYYKAKIEALPPQQRKILDQIARSTSRTREGMTPTEIATETRLPVNQVSSQLKRLSEAGYVHTANTRGRSSFYTLSEPLYAIWHQMRFGRDARKRMNWLVTFLKNWYDSKELGTECERLQDIFRSYMSAGRRGEARDTLEYRRYLIEAIADSQTKVKTLESIVLSYLELSDVDTLKKDVLADVDITLFSQETQQRLSETGLVSNERVKLRLSPGSSEDPKQTEVAAILKLGRLALKNNRIDEAKERFQQVLNLDPPNQEGTILLAAILADEGKTNESSKLLSGLRMDVVPGSHKTEIIRFAKAFLENRFDDALGSLDEVLKGRPDFQPVWHLKAQTLQKMSRLDDALAAFDKIAEDQRNVSNWCLLAGILADMDRNEEALGALDRALLLDPESLEALRKKGVILSTLKRYDEALVFADRALSISSDSSEDWLFVGFLLLQSPEKALARLAPYWDSDKDNWLRYANNAVRAVALAGHWSLAKKLITVCHLEEELFPLARAMDYLQTNDDALIEKLSPDVKQIVIEIITTLRPKTSTIEKQRKNSLRNRKSRNKSRN
ncbi:MAG TPA: tetratricopeptide repeat protein [Pyrinomonadaceae bacterium]|nr:tetratricopeptide repeat protein [Pyrinomonadaceae bacterium]